MKSSIQYLCSSSEKGALGDLNRPSNSREFVKASIHPHIVAIPIPQQGISLCCGGYSDCDTYGAHGVLAQLYGGGIGGSSGFAHCEPNPLPGGGFGQVDGISDHINEGSCQAGGTFVHCGPKPPAGGFVQSGAGFGHWGLNSFCVELGHWGPRPLYGGFGHWGPKPP
ncbi:hypothetical protein GUJ93_ZPchr0005g15759 [Zizania palustris]|uniref:Uncharacterized protein n=1 Tax=Zizania palustris TaxID=103762 RepID=A0A8J5SMK6_ZIZPA|nr:hypothetical protein GUJ93_ZPchr0005g15759 [Zizania palustris]